MRIKKSVIITTIAAGVFITGLLCGKLHAESAQSTELLSKGRFESKENDVVFDSRDFETLLNSIKQGQDNAYSQGFEDGKGSVSMKEVIKAYDAITVSDVSSGAGTYTLSRDCLFYGRAAGGNWTNA